MKDIFCPRDNEILRQIESSVHPAKQCPKCRGLWLDENSLRNLSKELGYGLCSLSTIGDKKSVGINCPNCQSPCMLAVVKEIETDVCGCCNGVWFDGDELRKIILKVAKETRLKTYKKSEADINGSEDDSGTYSEDTEISYVEVAKVTLSVLRAIVEILF